MTGALVCVRLTEPSPRVFLHFRPSSSSLTVVPAALLAAVPEVAAVREPAVDVAVAVLGAGLEVVVADRAEEVAAAAAPVLARADDELGDTKTLSIIGRLGDVLSFDKFTVRDEEGQSSY